MAFTITNIATKVTEAGGVKFAVAQPCTTQRASLYGVEATCQNGFASDPALDIYVFTNPLAAVAKIESLTGQTLDQEESEINLGNYPNYNEATPGHYLVTAQRAEYSANHLPDAPLGILGCEYGHDPNPFVTDTEVNPYPRLNSGFLTIVLIFNNPAVVTDEKVFVRTRVVSE